MMPRLLMILRINSNKRKIMRIVGKEMKIRKWMRKSLLRIRNDDNLNQFNNTLVLS